MALTTDFAGRLLGDRYRLLAPLGAGASAQVFLAEDLRLSRQVAVKVLHPALVHDEAFLGRFRAEAHAAGSLNHPHILAVFDWGEGEEGPFLVLEYLGGGSLRHLLDAGPLLTPAQAVRVGAQAASGLAYAHGRGIVHRDVKPANLLFDDEGRVRVADFGVARALAQASWTDPGGAMVGTARYASPEQAEGLAVDGRSDVYALALVLYESLTGGLPFAADTPLTTLMARIGRQLPRHQELGALGDVLVWAADPDAACRPDAAGLAAHLEAIAPHLPPPDPLPLARPPLPLGGTLASGALAPDATGMVAAVGGAHDVTGALPLAAQATGLMAAPAAGLPPSTLGAPATGVMAAAPRHTAVVPRVPPSVPPGPEWEGPEAEAPRHRARWPWVLAVLGLAMLLAAGALYAVREQLFTPSHPVPAVDGLSLAAARSALGPDHFDLAVSGRSYSTTIPEGFVISQRPPAGTSMKEGGSVNAVVSKGLPPEQVPPLSGLDCGSAQRVLAVANLYGTCPPTAEVYSATVPGGQVVTWSYQGQNQPAQAPWHSTITLVVSKGPPPVQVPSLTGLSYQGAVAALAKDGLKAQESSQTSTAVPSGETITSDPAPGQSAPLNSTVTVIVSSGPPKVTIPSGLGGLTLNQVEAVLSALGLKVGTLSGPSDGILRSTNPGAGSTVAQGSSIGLSFAHAPATKKAPSAPTTTTSTSTAPSAAPLPAPKGDGSLATTPSTDAKGSGGGGG